MKKALCIIAITDFIIVISSFFCNAQSHNLVPVDSAHYEIIADTLFDRYSAMPNSKFNPDVYTYCPCAVDSVRGLISYRSSSAFRKFNKCLFLFTIDSEYYIRVGQMPNDKVKSLYYNWKSSSPIKIKRDIAEKYIAMIKQEIDKAQVPRFTDLLIVNDGSIHIFGDLEKGKYATTPIYDYSESVRELIKLSEKKLIKDGAN